MAKKVNAKETTPESVQPQRHEDADASVERRLIALYKLQEIDSQIDRIRIIRGELPLEVQDLEDEIIGLETRIEKFKEEGKRIEQDVVDKKNMIKECKTLIVKYDEQQKNVRNNREYESLSKEMEFQGLEIELCEKRIKEYAQILEKNKADIEKANLVLEDRRADLDLKKSELDEIIKETEEKEQILISESKNNEKVIEERYLTAYHRIRDNCRNGLAVVTVERDACGGCFNKIPHQRQMDIRMHKKIIVCEYCGRILVDQTIAAEVEQDLK